MFERFTDRARRVVVLAQEEARMLSHNYIGTEHILLGLTRVDEGVAKRILLDAGVDAERVRDEVIRALGGPARFPGAPSFVPTPAPPGPMWWSGPVPRRGRFLPPRYRFLPPVALLVAGWALFALALGAGILVGWAIWG